MTILDAIIRSKNLKADMQKNLLEIGVRSSNMKTSIALITYRKLHSRLTANHEDRAASLLNQIIDEISRYSGSSAPLN